MAYRVNISSGIIHDASKKHIKDKTSEKFKDVDTIEEAKIAAQKKGKIPKACEQCGFPDAVKQQICS